MGREQDLEIVPAAAPSAPPQPTMEQLEVETAADENLTPTRSNLRMFAVLTSLYLSLFVAALDQTIVSTAIPTIASQLHSAAGYTWIGGAYLLAKAAAMPIWAKLSDIWGRKPIILAALLIFFSSSILCALARTMATLIAGRAVQGIGGGGLLQLTVITISDLFSLRRRSLFLGLTELMWAAAGGAGPVLGGALAQHASWRWIFWLNLPVAGAAAALAALALDVHNPRTRAADGLRAVDWFGAAAMLGMTLMLLLGLNFGGVVAAWSSAEVVCLLVFGAIMVVVFVVGERRLAAHPLMPMRLFGRRASVAAFAASFVHGFVFIAAEYYLPLYFQAAKLASPTRSGLLILPLVVSEALAAIATGVAIHRTGEYRVFLQAGMALAVLGVALFTLFRPDTPVATIVGLEVLAGLGIGLGFQPPVIAVQAVVAQRDVAAATAAIGFMKNLATSLSIVLGGVVFQNSMGLREPALRAAGVAADLASELAGPDAAANVELIGTIEDAAQQLAVKDAFAWSMRNMWIMYACVAACGVVATLFVERSPLSKEHTETKTGLEKEEVQAVIDT